MIKGISKVLIWCPHGRPSFLSANRFNAGNPTFKILTNLKPIALKFRRLKAAKEMGSTI